MYRGSVGWCSMVSVFIFNQREVGIAGRQFGKGNKTM